ncbi:MAG: glycosyltransferase [Rhodobacteraceae bacterium]|nr:glycosyltransferase [Paracoccaceae bacterium]
MTVSLPNIVVMNLHPRYTGISATIQALVPEQQRHIDIAVIDRGGLGLSNCWSLAGVVLAGFRRPEDAECRVWHARRDIDMMLGILLRALPGQNWRLVNTSAANRKPGPVLRRLMNAMDVVVAASDRSAGLIPWHSARIGHGVDTEFFHPPPENESPTAVIGYIGRIRPSKGTDLFVRSMISLLPSHPGYRAEIAGLCRPQHKDFLAGLKEEIRNAGLADRIQFLGHADRETVRLLYQRMAICVAPPRPDTEGFGLVPLEALACGVPVVVSDGSAAWRKIIDDEIGIIAEAGSADSLTEAVSAMLRHPELHYGLRRAARQRAVERLSIQVEAAALNEIYRRLLRGGTYPRLTPATEGC